MYSNQNENCKVIWRSQFAFGALLAFARRSRPALTCFPKSFSSFFIPPNLFAVNCSFERRLVDPCSPLSFTLCRIRSASSANGAECLVKGRCDRNRKGKLPSAAVIYRQLQVFMLNGRTNIRRRRNSRRNNKVSSGEIDAPDVHIKRNQENRKSNSIFRFLLSNYPKLCHERSSAREHESTSRYVEI